MGEFLFDGLGAPIIDGWEFSHGSEADFANFLSIYRANIDETCGTLSLAYDQFISNKGALIYYTSGDKKIGLALVDRRAMYMESIRIFSFSSDLPSSEIIEFLEKFVLTIASSIYFVYTENTGRYEILKELSERLGLKPVSTYKNQFNFWRKYNGGP